MSVSAQTRLPQPAAVRIDFGWITQARVLASAQGGVWAGAVFLCFLLNVGFWLLLALPTGELAAFYAAFHKGFAAGAAHTHRLPAPSAVHFLTFAEEQAASILLTGIGTVFKGGLYRMALRQKRGEKIMVPDLFSALPQSLPLFLVGIVVPVMLGLVESAAWWLLHDLRAPFSSASAVNQMETGLRILLDSLLMFAPLLVIDTGASVPDALLGSMRLLGRQWLRGIWFYVAAALVGVIGLLLCGVGMLATYPIYLISITIAYLALTQSGAETKLFDPTLEGVWPPPPRVPQENQP